MRRFRQGSVAKRAAISVIAIYALLLQAFLTASAPAVASPDGTILCVQAGPAQGPAGSTPAGHHHDCPCCILCCAAALCTPAGADSAAIVFPSRVASAIEFPATPVPAARSFLKHFFAARGPPESF
jgi:hypothetical protein